MFTEVGETFKITLQRPEERILNLISETGIIDLRALRLNKRQVKALAILVNGDHELTNREYRQMFDITYVTAFRDLTVLVNADQASMIGSGRSRSSWAQVKLLTNVWCSRCADSTTIIDFRAEVVGGDLMLMGACQTCGATVRRLIESEPDPRT